MAVGDKIKILAESNIVDSLTSTDTLAPLSAAQGKELKDGSKLMTVQGDIVDNVIIAGMETYWDQGGGLIVQTPIGVAYFDGVRRETAHSSYTCTANKTTYIEMRSDGYFNWVIVDVGTTTPLVEGTNLRLSAVTTSDTEVISIVDLRNYYIDPDAIGANPTAKQYPDGTIVGSTDNGEYIKYPDGRLTITGVTGIYTTDVAYGSIYVKNITGVIVFPIILVDDTYSIFTQAVYDYGTTWSGRYYSQTVTGFNCTLFGAGSSYTGAISYKVEGRWK